MLIKVISEIHTGYGCKFQFPITVSGSVTVDADISAATKSSMHVVGLVHVVPLKMFDFVPAVNQHR